MTDQSKLPLWRAMDAAYDDALQRLSLTATWHTTRAAELRALADWLVPEERGVTHQMHDPDLHRSRQRHQLRNILLDEADRAEEGGKPMGISTIPEGDCCRGWSQEALLLQPGQRPSLLLEAGE